MRVQGEMRQAQWFARAVSTFLSDRYISHIGFYEIKDLRRDEAAIGTFVILSYEPRSWTQPFICHSFSHFPGDIINYSLGLCTSDRQKKMAFSTVKILVSLLGTSNMRVVQLT